MEAGESIEWGRKTYETTFAHYYPLRKMIVFITYVMRGETSGGGEGETLVARKFRVVEGVSDVRVEHLEGGKAKVVVRSGNNEFYVIVKKFYEMEVKRDSIELRRLSIEEKEGLM